MELRFTLISKRGHVGDFVCEWNFPHLPRIGECLHMENFFEEGRFIASGEHDRIKKEVGNIKGYVEDIEWKIYDLTWLHQDGKIFPSYMMRSDE